MPQSEFSLIERYFANTGRTQYSAKLSQGDDAAIVEIPQGKQAVMSVDTLVSGIHFPEQSSAADIAHKALAVNFRPPCPSMGDRPLHQGDHGRCVECYFYELCIKVYCHSITHVLQSGSVWYYIKHASFIQSQCLTTW